MDTYEDQHRQSGMVMENMSAFKVTCVPRWEQSYCGSNWIPLRTLVWVRSLFLKCFC
jgi:hypothetical protein